MASVGESQVVDRRIYTSLIFIDPRVVVSKVYYSNVMQLQQFLAPYDPAHSSSPLSSLHDGFRNCECEVMVFIRTVASDMTLNDGPQ